MSKTEKIICGIIILVTVIFCSIMINEINRSEQRIQEIQANNPNYSSSSSTKTCQVCDRKFDKSSDDGWSITKRNMCENCYRNYKSLEQFIGQ